MDAAISATQSLRTMPAAAAGLTPGQARLRKRRRVSEHGAGHRAEAEQGQPDRGQPPVGGGRGRAVAGGGGDRRAPPSR